MTHQLEAFRTEIRAWLQSAVPQSLYGKPLLMPSENSAEPAGLSEDRARYLECMAARGFTAPMWPTQYGGAGLSREQAAVLQDELTRLRLPPALLGMGLAMIGPTLLVHGSEAQKRTYLPKIVTGEYRFCQGFSEPGAGSDLAALRTSAQLDDSREQYVINGQKIWTSGAQFANWMFMLVRTDLTQKQAGITFLLVDMQTPGIEVRPIRLISGNSMFCEVFFTDVKAHTKDVVGAVNDGWTVAKTLLNFERSGMGTGSLSGGARRPGAVEGTKIAALAKQYAGEDAERIADPVLRDEIAALLIDEMSLTLTVRRSTETRKATGAAGPEMSLLKLCQSELGQRRDELILRLRGSGALGWEGSEFSQDSLAQTRLWLGAKATTIYGGSSEIQRNIIAKRILRLPQSGS